MTSLYPADYHYDENMCTTLVADDSTKTWQLFIVIKCGSAVKLHFWSGSAYRKNMEVKKRETKRENGDCIFSGRHV